MARWTMDRYSPLVARPARPAVAMLAVVAAVGTALLGWQFAGRGKAGRTDEALAGLVDMRAGVVKTLGQAFADLGGPAPVLVAMVLTAVLAHLVRGPRGAALVVVGPAAAMVTTSLLLKPLVDRTRGDTLAFPSGHTTSVASLTVAVVVLVLGATTLPRLVRGLTAVAGAVLIAAVGASLVGRGYHYPTDTVGGVGVSVAVVLATALVIDLVLDGVGGRADTEVTQVLPRVGAGHR